MTSGEGRREGGEEVKGGRLKKNPHEGQSDARGACLQLALYKGSGREFMIAGTQWYW